MVAPRHRVSVCGGHLVGSRHMVPPQNLHAWGLKYPYPPWYWVLLLVSFHICLMITSAMALELCVYLTHQRRSKRRRFYCRLVHSYHHTLEHLGNTRQSWCASCRTTRYVAAYH